MLKHTHSHTQTCFLKVVLYMFCVNMDAEDSSAESMEDITAAATEPIPNTDNQVGVRYCRASGRMFPASPRSKGGGRPYAVWFQSWKKAEEERGGDGVKINK